MPNNNILKKIASFLHRDTPSCLKITFHSLEILTYHNGILLNHTLKQNSKIHIHARKNKCLAQMEVLDHLVFQFSFCFPPPSSLETYQSKQLFLPRPLSNGVLTIDAEKLHLEFTIDAAEENLKVKVEHLYTNRINPILI